MGNLLNLGFIPFKGILFPTGWHNAFPDQMREYIPVYTDTCSPFFSLSGFSVLTYYPLGIRKYPDHLFNTPLNRVYKAITTRNIRELETIDDFNFESEVFQGMNALQLAATLNNYEAMHYLLKIKKVEINKKFGPYGKTALHIAIENGNDLAALYLLNNGANIRLRDKFGFNSYDKAEYRGYYQMIDKLKKYEEQIKRDKSKLANKDAPNIKPDTNKQNQKTEIIENPFDKSTERYPSDLHCLHFFEDREKECIDVDNLSVYFVKDFHLGNYANRFKASDPNRTLKIFYSDLDYANV